MATGGGGPQLTGQTQEDPFAIFDSGSSSTITEPKPTASRTQVPSKPAGGEDPFAVFDNPSPSPTPAPNPSPAPSPTGGVQDFFPSPSPTPGQEQPAQQPVQIPFLPNPKLPPVHKNLDMHQIDASEVIRNAQEWVGQMYEAGKGSQCANFLREFYKRMGVRLGVSKEPLDLAQTQGLPQGPGFANSLSGKDIGKTVENEKELRTGDIVLYQNTIPGYKEGTITHVGVYTRNGNVLHRSSSGKVVEVPVDTITGFKAGVRPSVNLRFSGSNKEIVDTVLSDSGFSIQDQSIMRRMFGQESHFDHKAVSSAGAMGLGQMMPDTAAPYLAKYGYTSDDYMNNPQVQAFVSTQHMQSLLNIYDGNWARALAAYNGGRGAVNTAMKNGRWNPSQDPNSYFVQTRQYVAHILGVSPEEAEQMVVQGNGPAANVMTPSEQVAADRESYKSGFQAWNKRFLNTVNESGANPLKSSFEFQAMDALTKSRELDAERGVEGDLFKDITEGGKAMARGFLCGMLEVGDYQDKIRKSIPGGDLIALSNPLSMAYIGNPIKAPDFIKGATGKTLLQNLAPDKNYMAPVAAQIDQDYKVQGIPEDRRGFGSWVADTARWAWPGGNPGRDPLNIADREALMMEVPTLAGMVISAEMLGPEAGVLSRTEKLSASLAKPGDLAFAAFSKVFPKQAQSLGKEFFQNSALWGSVGAMQMASSSAGDAIAAGGGPDQVASAALSGAFMGYVTGMGFPLVFPTLSAGSEKAFGEAISRASKAYREAKWRPQLERSMNDFINRMDESAFKGYFKAAILDPVARFNKTFVGPAQQDAARKNTVDGLDALQNLYRKTEYLYREMIARKTTAVDQMEQRLNSLNQQVSDFEQRMPNVAIVAQEIGQLQEQLGLWNRAQAQYMQAKGAANAGNPAALQQFDAEVASVLGVKDPSKFKSEAHSRIKQIKQDIDKNLADEGYDPVTVQTYMEAKKAQNKLQEQLIVGKQDPVYQHRDIYEKDLGVIEHTANKVQAIRDNVHGGYSGIRATGEQYFDPWFDQTFKGTPAIELPTTIDPAMHPEELTSITAQFDQSLAAVVDAGLSFGQVGDQLAFEVTRLSRGLMDANKAGAKVRMDDVVNGLAEELAILKSNEPKAPSKPARKNLNEADYNAAMRQWEQQHGQQHAADMETWKSKVESLSKMYDTAQEARSTLFGTKFTEPGLARQNIVNQSYREALPVVEQQLRDAGVKGGFDQLDGMLNTREIPEARISREVRKQWTGSNKADQAAAEQSARAQAQNLKNKKGKPASQRAKDLSVKKAVNAVKRDQAAKRQQLLNLGKTNGGFVEAEIPTSWLHPDPLDAAQTQLAQDITGPTGMSQAQRERSVFVGDIDPHTGKLQIVDGKKRILAAVHQGQDSVKAFVPRDVWEATVAGKLPSDILERTQRVEQALGSEVDVEGNPIRPNYAAGVRNTVMAEAEQWYRDLTPVQRDQALAQEVGHIAEVFRTDPEVGTPSLARYNTVMAGETPASWVQTLGTNMQALLMNNALARRSMQDWMEFRFPSGLKQMFKRSEQRLQQYVHEQALGHQISTHISADFKRGYGEALTAASSRVQVTGVPSRMVRAEQEKLLQREMVDALQQMPNTNEPIRQFLAKYPEMRQPLGAYFDMLRTLEQWKIASPELRTFFNEVGFAHVFPRLTEIVKSASKSGKQSTINTRLASEMRRQYPTLADAEKAYQDASTKVMNGRWGKGDPGTLKERENTFINATPERRMEILGLDPSLPKSKATAERTMLKLGLRDPILDPTEIIRRQIQSTMYADSVRSLLSDLAKLPIPGLQTLDGRSGKPYTVLSHFPHSVSNPEMHGSPPIVPTIRGPKRLVENSGVAEHRSSRMVSLTDDSGLALSEHATVNFNGQEVPAKELYIHPDVSDLIKDRILTGREANGTVWNDLAEATRLGALVGSPIPHGLNIASDHWGALTAHAVGSLFNDLFPVKKANMGSLRNPKLVESRGFNPAGLGSGLQEVLSVPRKMVGMYSAGNELAASTSMLIDATQHGAALHTWNAYARTAVEQTVEFLQKEASDIITPEELEGFRGFMHDVMEKAPTAQDAATRFIEGVKTGPIPDRAKSMLNGVVNADYFMNKWAMFEPIRQAQVAGYAYWSAVHWKDMGQKLLDSGVPMSQALKIVKQEAANYVNLVSGVAPPYKDAKLAREVAYGMPGVGPIFSALTPGWLRAKVHAMMSIMDPILSETTMKIPGHGRIENPIVGAAEKMGWDRRTMGEYAHVENPAYKEYLQSQWRKHFVVQLASGFAALQVASYIFNGGFTWQLNPDNVKKWFSLRVGDRDYAWPVFGIFKDTVRAIRGFGGNDMGDLMSMFTDQLQPTMRIGYELAKNQDRSGSEIYSRDRSLMAAPDKAADIGKYVLSQYMNPEDTLGISMHPYPFAGMRESSNWGMPDWVASQLGFHPSPYNEPLSEKSYMEGLIGFQRQHMQDYVRVDLERWARDGDRAALDRAIKQALIDGIPIHGDTKDIMKLQYPDGHFRMSSDSFHQMLMKVLEPTGYALDKLPPSEKAWLFQRLERYREAQGRLTPYYFVKREKAARE